MSECRQCGCNCDPGDLEQGVCYECREENEIQYMRAKEVAMIMNAECEQLEMGVC